MDNNNCKNIQSIVCVKRPKIVLFNNEKIKYKSYQHTIQWKILRHKRKIMDKFICQLCNNKKGKDMQVHHTNYPSDMKNDCTEFLLTVCKNCHAKLHGIKLLTKQKSLNDYFKNITLLDYYKENN